MLNQSIPKDVKVTSWYVKKHRENSFFQFFPAFQKYIFHEKVALAASAVLNGWILTQANSTDHCWLRFVSFSIGKLIIILNKKKSANITLIRNICELGYNGAVWGNIGEAVVEVKHVGILGINNLQLR